MNLYFLIAALLLIAIAIGHSYLGERHLLASLLSRNVPPLYGSERFAKDTLRIAWHVTSLAWGGLAAVLLFFAQRPPADAGRFVTDAIAATFLASSLLFIIGSRARHLTWIPFLLIAVLLWVGARS